MKRWPVSILVIILALVLSAGCAIDSDDDDDTGNPPTGDDDDDQPPDSPPYYDPNERGPYQVGVVTHFPVDESRYERWGGMDRVLPIEIWYPSTGAGGRPNQIAEILGELPGWVTALLQFVWGEQYEPIFEATTSAMREAELLPGAAPYPIFLHSHGYSAVRFQNYTICEHLASHGYIVVAPDHYGNALITNPPGDDWVILNPLDSLEALDDRKLDIEFLYNYLSVLNTDPESRFYQQLDLGRFGIGGHSYGGTTSLISGLNQSFVKVAAPSNPFWLEEDLAAFDKPLLVHLSELDTIVTGSNPVMREGFSSASSDRKVLINMYTGTHYSATDACRLIPELLYDVMSCDDGTIDYDLANRIVAGYLTAFLQATLGGDGRYSDYLYQNAYPDQIELITEWEQPGTP